MAEDIDFTTITTKIFNLKSSNPHEMFKVGMTILDKKYVDPHSYFHFRTFKHVIGCDKICKKSKNLMSHHKFEHQMAIPIL